MDRKGITMSVVLATLVLVSLFAAVGSAASVSGTTMAGTGPAISTSFYNGQSNIFAVDSSGALWNTRITPSGGGIWNSLGGVSTSSPAAVSWGNTTRLDVFVRGADGALWHKYYQNGWSKWESLGGRLASGTGPAVSSSSSGKLDVFVQGTDGALWHTSYNNSWSKWESLGGKLTSSPAATAGSHVSDIFCTRHRRCRLVEVLPERLVQLDISRWTSRSKYGSRRKWKLHFSFDKARNPPALYARYLTIISGLSLPRARDGSRGAASECLPRRCPLPHLPLKSTPQAPP